MRVTWLGAVLAATLTLPLHAELATAPVQHGTGAALYSADGVVEAVRQSELAGQVAGEVTALPVKAGDSVKADQLLARIDPRTAAEQWAASRAQLEAARNEYERSRELFRQQFISQAAMDRAEAQYKALRAQANAAGTQTGFHTIRAPYAGVVGAVYVELGTMALPGKPLFTVYDPNALRVVATVPESIAAQLDVAAGAELEIPGAPAMLRRQRAQHITVLPLADPGSHTRQLRLTLPAGLQGIAPGQFARASLPLAGTAAQRLTVPASALIRRTEFYAVYVVDSGGRAQLRQVRPGRTLGDRVEILAGVAAGERVALDPLAAARQR